MEFKKKPTKNQVSLVYYELQVTMYVILHIFLQVGHFQYLRINA